MNSNPVDSGTAPVRILVVDDFKPSRTIAASILEEQPEYRIVGKAAGGVEAVQTAMELKPDLVVLDIGLPDLNGIEVARQIRKCCPDSTILFLSGNNDPEVVREALRAGARGYVHKSDVATDLVAAVKEVLSGKRFLSRRLDERSSDF